MLDKLPKQLCSSNAPTLTISPHRNSHRNTANQVFLQLSLWKMLIWTGFIFLIPVGILLILINYRISMSLVPLDIQLHFGTHYLQNADTFCLWVHCCLFYFLFFLLTFFLCYSIPCQSLLRKSCSWTSLQSSLNSLPSFTLIIIIFIHFHPKQMFWNSFPAIILVLLSKTVVWNRCDIWSFKVTVMGLESTVSEFVNEYWNT